MPLATRNRRVTRWFQKNAVTGHQEAPTPLMDTASLRTAATRQVTAGAAEFGSAEIRCSSFDAIFVETKSTDQRKY